MRKTFHLPSMLVGFFLFVLVCARSLTPTSSADVSSGYNPLPTITSGCGSGATVSGPTGTLYKLSLGTGVSLSTCLLTYPVGEFVTSPICAVISTSGLLANGLTVGGTPGAAGQVTVSIAATLGVSANTFTILCGGPPYQP